MWNDCTIHLFNMEAMASTDFVIKARNHLYQGLTEDDEGIWKGPFCFIQAADTQFGMIESYLEKNPDPKWDKEIALTRTAIANVNKMEPKPKFFVVCGDLVDAWPETQSERRTLQEKDFKSVFAELNPDIPLVCVCGNHDVGNVPSKDSVARYRSNFGDEYFSFWVGGMFCIVLNSSYYVTDVDKVADLVEEQDRWLQDQLAVVPRAKHGIVFQHIPWFLRKPDEPWDPYFTIDLPQRTRLLDKFKAAGVKKVFCGHYHRNAGGWDGDLEVVVTSAIGAQLGQDKHGLRVVSVTDDHISHRYYELDNIPQHVNLA